MFSLIANSRCEAISRGAIDKTAISEDESLTDGTVSEEEDMLVVQEIVEDRNHDFKRTHFHSATQCDFCRKKVCRLLFYIIISTFSMYNDCSLPKTTLSLLDRAV